MIEFIKKIFKIILTFIFSLFKHDNVKKVDVKKEVINKESKVSKKEKFYIMNEEGVNTKDSISQINKDLLKLTNKAMDNIDVLEELNELDKRVDNLKDNKKYQGCSKEQIKDQIDNVKKLVSVNNNIDTVERTICRPAFIEYIEVTNEIIKETYKELDELNKYYERHDEYHELCDYIYKVEKIRKKYKEIIKEYENIKDTVSYIELKKYSFKDPYDLKYNDTTLKVIYKLCEDTIKESENRKHLDVVVEQKVTVKEQLKEEKKVEVKPKDKRIEKFEENEYSASNTILNYASSCMQGDMVIAKNKLKNRSDKETVKRHFVENTLDKTYQVAVLSFPFHRFTRILGITTSLILINNGVRIIRMFLNNNKLDLYDKYSMDILKVYEDTVSQIESFKLDLYNNFKPSSLTKINMKLDRLNEYIDSYSIKPKKIVKNKQKVLKKVKKVKKTNV